MASRGSVIPFFISIANENGTLPITDNRMTRFMISLEEGVELVWHAFDDMQGGEIYVKKIPSMKVLDIAHVVAPKVKHKIIGIRPGEKLHEALCIKDEAHLTIEFKDHYVVEPTTWDFSDKIITYYKNNLGEKGKKVHKNFEYNSFINKDILDIKSIKTLLKKY